MTMPNSKYMLGNKFDKLHFHAKPQVKRKTTTKNKSSSSLKRSDHLESKIGDFEKSLRGYTFM